MPGGPLIAPEPEPGSRPEPPFEGYAGFFGKLPLAGDFVSRGLAVGLRDRWDAWATRHLARWEGPWPEGGLRLLLPSGSRALLVLAVPSEDRVGRRFPLAALAVLPGAPDAEEAEGWCRAAAGPLGAAARGALDPDGLAEALAALPLPGPERPRALAWAAGDAPAPLDLADPGPALAALSSRGSSSP